MGDRCYWEATVRRSDAPAFVAHIMGVPVESLPPVEEWKYRLGMDCEVHDAYVHIVDEEANHGHGSAMEELAEDCVFAGRHDEGDDYSGACFASTGDGRLHGVCALGGEAVALVQFDEVGTPFMSDDALRIASAWWQADRKVRQMLGLP